MAEATAAVAQRDVVEPKIDSDGRGLVGEDRELQHVPGDRVPVHLAAGIWGTISIGLFASGKYGFASPTGANLDTLITGLFYGGGTTQLVAQAIGSAALVGATLVVSGILMYAVKATGTLRVSAAGEMEGLDLHEHGAVAYPEYMMDMNDGTPKTLEDVKLKPASVSGD